MSSKKIRNIEKCFTEKPFKTKKIENDLNLKEFFF